jgi:hypothetical protein
MVLILTLFLAAREAFRVNRLIVIAIPAAIAAEPLPVIRITSALVEFAKGPEHPAQAHLNVAAA